MAHAQTNIDEGLSAAQIFAADCATCHKSTRGLAGGRGSLALKGFLAEHYTSSNDQAAALAAYVLGAGGSESAPATQGRGQKPATEHARLPSEEPTPPGHPTRQTGKREGEVPATAKLQPPTNEDAKPATEPSMPSIMQEPPAASDQRPAATRHENQPAAVTRGRRQEPQTVPPASKPAAVIAEPASHETPVQEARPGLSTGPGPAPSAAAPANAASDENTPVPRDNIPD
jgi:hypothetical protein